MAPGSYHVFVFALDVRLREWVTKLPRITCPISYCSHLEFSEYDPPLRIPCTCRPHHSYCSHLPWAISCNTNLSIRIAVSIPISKRIIHTTEHRIQRLRRIVCTSSATNTYCSHLTHLTQYDQIHESVMIRRILVLFTPHTPPSSQFCIYKICSRNARQAVVLHNKPVVLRTTQGCTV